jgi:hypothetical protein
MAKRKAESQISSLTPNHKKFRIDPIYLATEGMQHTIGKLWTRATTLLETTLPSEVCSQSYGAPKLRESQPAWFRDSHWGVSGGKSRMLAKLWGSKVAGILTGEILKLPFRSLGREKPFGCRLRG